MKLFFMTLGLVASNAYCQFSDITPTQYLLPLIAQSRTLWKANFLWKERLKETTHEETSLIETAEGTVFKGGWVKSMPLRVDGIKAYFTIDYDAQKDTVTVGTTAEGLATKTATETEQPLLIKQQSKQVVFQQNWQKDDYTRCHGTHSVTYHPQTHQFVHRAQAVCTTVMPFDLFMAALNTADRARN